MVKFSVYLNRLVFVMQTRLSKQHRLRSETADRHLIRVYTVCMTRMVRCAGAPTGKPHCFKVGVGFINGQIEVFCQLSFRHILNSFFFFFFLEVNFFRVIMQIVVTMQKEKKRKKKYSCHWFKKIEYFHFSNSENGCKFYRNQKVGNLKVDRFQTCSTGSNFQKFPQFCHEALLINNQQRLVKKMFLEKKSIKKITLLQKLHLSAFFFFFFFFFGINLIYSSFS